MRWERPALGDLLRVEASRHEPDRDRILSAIRDGQVLAPADDVRLPAGTLSHSWIPTGGVSGPGAGHAAVLGRRGGAGHQVEGCDHGGGVGWIPGRRLAWPMAAASVAVLTLATVAGARMLAPEAQAPTARPLPSGTASLGPAVIIDGSPTPDSTERPTSSSAPQISAERAQASPSTSRIGAAQSGDDLADAVSTRVVPAVFGTWLSLPRSGDRDWIVVGGRQDGVTVRAKSPSRPLGSVTVSGSGPSVVEGPYQVSWKGGTPEQSHDLDTTWQSITAVDGRIRTTVPLRGDSFSVDLFAGTVRVTGKVTVRLAGSSAAPVQALLKPCQVDVCADVVTVTVDSSKLPAAARSGELLIDLGPANPGDSFGLGMAAVALH